MPRRPGRHEGAGDGNLGQVDDETVDAEPDPEQREGQVLKRKKEYSSQIWRNQTLDDINI